MRPPPSLTNCHTHTHTQADPTLRALLLSIPLPKYVFTNADRAHAARCLALLGVADCFERVIAFEDVMEAAEQVGCREAGWAAAGEAATHWGDAWLCAPASERLLPY